MTGTESLSIDQLRALLRSLGPRDNLRAMDGMVPLKGAAAPLVSDLPKDAGERLKSKGRRNPPPRLVVREDRAFSIRR